MKKIISILTLITLLSDLAGQAYPATVNNKSTLAVFSKVGADEFRFRWNVESICSVLSAARKSEEIVPLLKRCFGKDKVLCPLFDTGADDILIKINGGKFIVRCCKKSCEDHFLIKDKVILKKELENVKGYRVEVLEIRDRTITKKAPGTADLGEGEKGRIEDKILEALENGKVSRVWKDFTSKSNLLEIIENTKQEHAPPGFIKDLKEAVEEDLLKLNIVPIESMGFPRDTGQKDIYAYTEKSDGAVNIYVTKGFLKHIKRSENRYVILSQLLAHEYAENILGKSHRESCLKELYFSKNKDYSELTALSVETAGENDLGYLASIESIHPNDPYGKFYELVQKKIEQIKRKKAAGKKAKTGKPEKPAKKAGAKRTGRKAADVIRYIYEQNRKGIDPKGINIRETGKRYGILAGSMLIKKIIDNYNEDTGSPFYFDPDIKHGVTINQNTIHKIVKEETGEDLIPDSKMKSSYSQILTISDYLCEKFREKALEGGVSLYFDMAEVKPEIEDMNLGNMRSIIKDKEKVTEILRRKGLDVEEAWWEEKSWNVPVMNARADQIRLIGDYFEEQFREKALEGGVSLYFDLAAAKPGLKDMNSGNMYTVIGDKEKVTEILSRRGLNVEEMWWAEQNWDIPYINARAYQIRLIGDYFEEKFREKALEGGVSLYFDLAEAKPELENMHFSNMRSVIGDKEKVTEILKRRGLDVGEKWWAEQNWDVPYINARADQIRLIGDYFEEKFRDEALEGGVSLYFDLAEAKAELKDMNLGHMHSVIGDRGKVTEILRRRDLNVAERWWKEKKWDVPAMNVRVDQIRLIGDYFEEKFRDEALEGGVSLYFDIAAAKPELKDMNFGHIHSVIGNKEKVTEVLRRRGLNMEEKRWEEKDWAVPYINARVDQIRLIGDYFEEQFREKALEGGVSLYFDIAEARPDLKDMHFGNMKSVIKDKEKVTEILRRRDLDVEEKWWKEKNWNIPHIDARVDQIRLIGDYFEEQFREKALEGGVSLYFDLVAAKPGLKDMHFSHMRSVIRHKEKVTEILRRRALDVGEKWWKEKKWDVPVINARADQIKLIGDYFGEKFREKALEGGESLYLDLVAAKTGLKDMHLGHMYTVIGDKKTVTEILKRLGLDVEEKWWTKKEWYVPYKNIPADRMSSLEKKDAEKELAEKVPVQERSTTDMLKELNRVNRAFTDVPDNGEKICYVIPTTIMPPEEYSWRTAINRASSGSWAGEKVRIIHTEQVLSEDEKKDMMIEKINLLRREFKKVYIALPESWQDIELPADVKELKFDGCRHTEEIIVALRAFSRGGDEGVRALTELYEILTGRAYPENVDFDPVDRDKFEHFAQVLVYSLPGMKKLDAYKDNRLLRKLLLSA